LLLNGTAAEPVVFTSYYDDTVAGDTNGDGNATTPRSGDWGRVLFRNAGTGSLDNAVMRYGGGGHANSCCTANPATDAILSISTSAMPLITGINIQQSQARGAYINIVGGFTSEIQNSTFSNNTTAGIEIHGGNAMFTLTRVAAEANATDGIWIQTTGPITIASSDATANGGRGFVVATSGRVIMTDSSSSSQTNGYGLDLPQARSDSVINNNRFFLNRTQVRTVPALAEEIIINNTLLNTQRGIVLTAGIVDIDTTWPEPGYVYVVEGDITVQAGRTLSISPGAVLKFQVARDNWNTNDRDLIVNGTLNAIGTPAAPVSFTSHFDDTVGGDTNVDGVATLPRSGDWGRIRFASGSSGTLRHVDVRYGGGGHANSCCTANPATDGQISVGSTQAPTLDNILSRFSQSRGIYLDVSGGFTTTVSNSQFLQNGSRGIEVVHGMGPIVLDTV
jgi:hypothetical protein